jgi:hypothetical protein
MACTYPLLGSFRSGKRNQKKWLLAGMLEVHADDMGDPMLSRAQFLHALDARSSEKRVCRAIQLNLVAIKAAFYQLTGPLAADSQLLTPFTVCCCHLCAAASILLPGV